MYCRQEMEGLGWRKKPINFSLLHMCTSHCGTSFTYFLQTVCAGEYIKVTYFWERLGLSVEISSISSKGKLPAFVCAYVSTPSPPGSDPATESPIAHQSEANPSLALPTCMQDITASFPPTKLASISEKALKMLVSTSKWN